nr:ubiquitin domain containing protein 2 [Hymenolepis microstoma]
MGNRFHRSDVPSYRGGGNNWTSPKIAVGKNQPLKRGAARWISSQPIYASQLRQKREEFWDTAPAFEGRQEIWDALKCAAEAAERGDHEMAQAIIDSANIILPTGTLAESYDELGNRYQLPVFVLSQPTNLEPDPSGEGPSTDLPIACPSTSSAPGTIPTTVNVTIHKDNNDDGDNDFNDEGVTVVSLLSPHAPTSSSALLDNPPHLQTSSDSQQNPSSQTALSPQESSNPFFRLFRRRRQRRAHSLGKKSRRKNRSSISALLPSVGSVCSSAGDGSAIVRPFDLRMRLSTGDEYSLPVTSSQSVMEAKKHLATIIGFPPDRQRWYCGGVALRDGLRIADCPSSIAPPVSFMVQVVVHSPMEPESTWKLQVAQAFLDAKLFQDPKIEDHIDPKSEFSISNASSKIFIPSQYFCGFPVPKDNARTGDPSTLIGAVVLVKGGLIPIIANYDRPPLSGGNLSFSQDFNFYVSVYCARRLISNLPNPTLSRYVTFLERVLSVSLSKPEKAALNDPNLCVDKTVSGGDPTAHILVRAYAIASQIASAYAPPLNSAPTPDDLNIRLFATSITAQSRLEALALLASLLTIWADSDEQQFQSYLNVFKASHGNRWIEEIENPLFCVPSASFSCTCPRQLLVHSVFERRRTHLMSSLRREATSVHSLLPPTVHALALAAGADNPSNPYWPHRILALLSKSLCNKAVPLTPKNMTPMNSARVTIRICERRQGSEEVSQDCVSESVVQRLWEITSYAERKLENSSAHLEFAKLASFPFLRTVEQEIAKISSNEGKDKMPWLKIYAGQPDSVYLFLKALNISVGTLDHQRSAGRLVIEIHRFHSQQESLSAPINLRFFLDGVDIGESLKPIGLCEGKPPVCSADRFVKYLKESKFWGPILEAHLMNSSEDAFKFVCNSNDFRTLMK